MFKKAPTLEPIKLKLKLPENGSYPPRIVMPGETLWLQGDSVKVGKLTFVRDLHNNWKILADNKHKILVNGQEIVIDTVLSDGDYIRAGQWKGIFQADSVADYRHALQKEKIDDVIEVNPSQMLRDWVRLDYEGISLDGGENFTYWADVIKIEYHTDGNGKWKVNFCWMRDDGKVKKAPSKLKALLPDDFENLIRWVMCFMPFDPSMYSFLDNPNIWTDAYQILAYDKLYIPAENNQLILPEQTQKIFRRFEISKWERLFQVMLGLGGLLVLGIATAKPDDFSVDSIIAVISGSIVVAILLGIFWGIFWSLTNVERLYRQHKINKQIAAEEARKQLNLEKGE